MILVFALLLAALIGFTAHSAGICAVKAVSEVIHTRRGRMLASFGKTVLWIMTITVILLWIMPNLVRPVSLAPSLLSVTGAFVFGLGAALNGGCAVSTVTRLGNGELRMLLTVVGVTVAISGVDGGLLELPASARQSSRHFIIDGPALMITVTLLSGWALWEAARLWWGRDRKCGLIKGLLHTRLRLSLAAALIGLANAAIAVIAGPWAYTNTLRNAVDWRVADGMAPQLLPVGLFAALMLGVITSSLLRRSYRLRYWPKADWLRNLAGGILMGLGIVTVPGGNDGLLLEAIPSLSPHAIPAFAGLFLGVAAVLLVVPRLTDVGRVDCGGDICSDG